MESTHQNDSQLLKIQGLLDVYLSSRRTPTVGSGPDAEHLDEDSLSAFVEGSVSDRESIPVIKHLVRCSFCRSITTELIRLDAELSGPEVITTQPAAQEPSRVSEVLGGILDRMFGTSEPAVFAHGDKETEDEEKAERPED